MAIGGAVDASHLYLRIECELMGGGYDICCDAISDSGGSAPITYLWWDNNLGWYSDDETEFNWTNYHCSQWKTGQPHLYNSVDGGVLLGHGAAIGRCGVF